MPDQRGTELLIIGAGLAGLTAAVHAVKAGAKVRLIAQGWGQQMVSPGWISVCDRADDDVIAEVRGYAAMHPDHPYALAQDDAMIASLDAFRAMMDEVGLPYRLRRKDGHNMRLITSLGAIQRAMLAPRGIANGDWTDVSGPILLVSLDGWRDFHAGIAAGNLRSQGVEARAVTVELPGPPTHWDRWPGDLARQFDAAHFRAAVVRQLKPHLRRIERVGFPAVLGLDAHSAVLDDLSDQLGCPVFEIPTLPPSMPGQRLSSALKRWLLRRGVRVQIGHPVVRGLVEDGRAVGVEVDALGHAAPFYADHIILATGGLYNGGLQTDHTGRLWEPLFDLPVVGAPGDGRDDWYGMSLLQAQGHPIHCAGIQVDQQMRPLNQAREPVVSQLSVVGHMLAGFNPLTDGCAEGIALATAYKAVRVALQLDN